MFDARQLLNALVGAAAKRGEGGPQQGQGGGLADMLGQVIGSFGQGGQPGQGGATGQGAGQLADKAKDFMNRHPGLAEAALMSVAGLLIGGRRRTGVAMGAARLGGLALIASLAYKAYQNYQGGKPLLPGAGTGAPGAGAAGGGGVEDSAAAFDPGAATEDDALLFARAMVAAASADGRVDEGERGRIAQAMNQAGIDPQATRWLEDELASPASVEDLAAPVRNPEKAAQVYAAARLAVDPDTIQEREFLRQLAESLDLDPQLARQIDDAAAGVRV
jgi:uncharacterized membrane protein YebE (DUF533 family)